jgi:hypothetical protein
MGFKVRQLRDAALAQLRELGGRRLEDLADAA